MWYIVLTRPRQELRAKEHLQLQGGEVFLPLFQHETVRRGKRTEVQEPLFPGYLFLNVDEGDALLSKVRSTQGARQLLCFNNQPVKMAEQLIQDLHQRCKNADNAPQFTQGQSVTLKDGPFKNYQAIFKNYDGQERAIILLNLLNQQNELLVELTNIELF